jgi:hypothetical protein
MMGEKEGGSVKYKEKLVIFAFVLERNEEESN